MIDERGILDSMTCDEREVVDALLVDHNRTEMWDRARLIFSKIQYRIVYNIVFYGEIKDENL